MLEKIIALKSSWNIEIRKNFVFFLSGLLLFTAHSTTLKAHEFDGNVDYLFWNATQTNMSYGIAVGSTTALSLNDLASLSQATDWSSGFRLGARYRLACSWNAHFSWTRFHNDVSGSYSKTVVVANQLLAPDINNIIFGGGDIGGPASSRWDLNFDMFDLDFSCNFFDNCRFNCCSFIGLKGGKIKQCQSIQYVNFSDGANTVDATVDMRNVYWGVGPKFGLNSSYEIGCGINLVGSFSVGTLFGEQSSKNNTQLDVAGTPSTNKFTFSKFKLIPEIELYIGFDWSSILRECYAVSLAIGYETQYFWNPWRTQNSTIQNLYVTNAGFGDLMLHGLTVKFGVDF